MRLIDANALKKALSEKDLITWTHEYGDAIPFDWMMNTIDNAPTVEQPQGEWKPTNVSFGTCFLQGYECKCGRVVMQKEHFCPECGADMRGNKNEIQ